MATIHKLTKNGATIFPATITDAVVHPNIGKTLTSMIKEYNISELFSTEGIDGGNTYNLGLAIQTLGAHLTEDQKTGGIKLIFISSDSDCEEEYYLGKNVWSGNIEDWGQRFEVGDVIADSRKSWTPGTAEAYIDQKIEEVNTNLTDEINGRIAGDGNLRALLNEETEARTNQGNNLLSLIQTNSSDIDVLENNLGDKNYDSSAFSGMGRVYLQQNIEPLGFIFKGPIAAVTTQPTHLLHTPEAIYFDITNERFVARYLGEYYSMWTADYSLFYTNPTEGTRFYYYNENEDEYTSYVWSRNNLVGADTIMANVLEQNMINEDNTIYIVQYDFNLNFKSITIPNNCIVKIEGGKLINGNIISNSVIFKYDRPKSEVFEDIVFMDEENPANLELAIDGQRILQNDNGVLEVVSLADREIDDTEFRSTGKKFLQKNVQTVEGVEKNILTQAMFQNEDGTPRTNTIYTITLDYDLSQTITIPAGCTIELDGGSISNSSSATSSYTLNIGGTMFLPSYNSFLDVLGPGITVSGIPKAGTSYFQDGKQTWSNGTKWVDEKGYTAAINRGTTSERPTNTLTTSDAGYEYFDTTLGLPIYLKVTGSTKSWVKADGTNA